MTAAEDEYSGVYKAYPVHIPSSAGLDSDDPILVRLNSDNTLQGAMGIESSTGYLKICHAPFGAADCYTETTLDSFPELAYITTGLPLEVELMVSVSCEANLGFVSQFTNFIESFL